MTSLLAKWEHMPEAVGLNEQTLSGPGLMKGELSRAPTARQVLAAKREAKLFPEARGCQPVVGDPESFCRIFTVASWHPPAEEETTLGKFQS